MKASLRFIRLLPLLAFLTGLSGCKSSFPPLPAGLIPPDVRFEVAPEVGELFPDVTIVDDEGKPVNIRELAGKKPYTVLTLGCLT